MVRGLPIAVTAVPSVYQCADTHRMARGRGIDAPSRRQDSVYWLRSSVFIGLPCPKNTTGILGPSRFMDATWGCAGEYSRGDDLHVERALDEPDTRHGDDGERADDEYEAPVEPGRPEPIGHGEEHADDRELPAFHAEVETDQRDEERSLRQPQIPQHAREPEAVDQAEGERHHPAPPVDEREHVVERGEH